MPASSRNRAPTPEQIAETVRALDSIGAPVHIRGTDAARLLRAAGIPTSTWRASRAARERRGDPPRAPRATRTTTAVASTAQRAAEPHHAHPDPTPRLDAGALADAACLGRQPEFDAEIAGESATDARTRLRSAADVCFTCPVIDACDRARRALPPRHVGGVWAGRLYGRQWP